MPCVSFHRMTIHECSPAYYPFDYHEIPIKNHNEKSQVGRSMGMSSKSQGVVPGSQGPWIPGPAQPSWSPSSGAPSARPKSQHRWEMSPPPWGRCCCWWQVGEAGRRGDGDLGMLLLDIVGSCWIFNGVIEWD